MQTHIANCCKYRKIYFKVQWHSRFNCFPACYRNILCHRSSWFAWLSVCRLTFYGVLHRIAQVDRAGVVRFHQRDQSLHQVRHVLERAGLLSGSVYLQDGRRKFHDKRAAAQVTRRAGNDIGWQRVATYYGGWELGEGITSNRIQLLVPVTDFVTSKITIELHRAVALCHETWIDRSCPCHLST